MNSQDSCSKYGADSVDYVSSTKVEVDTFSFQWTIHNFSSQSLKDGIRSPKYVGGPNTKHVWSLVAMKTGPVTDDLEEFFKLHLCLCDGNSGGHKSRPKSVKASCRISILDPEDKPVYTREDQSDFHDFTLPEECLWYLFPIKRLFYPHPHEKKYLFNNTMKIHGQIWIQCGLKTTIKNSRNNFNMHPEKASTFESKLRRDLKMALSESTFSDVSIVTSTKTFRAHKFMLSARSSVFRTMFASSMIESTENSIEIPDFEEDVVDGMLEFMYSGKTTVCFDNARDLFRIADKYDLMDLKEMCETTLEKDLKVENACKILILAHLHDANELKITVMDYINLNKMKIVTTEGFKELGKVYPVLLQDLYMFQ